MSFPNTLVGIAALAVIGALLVFGGRGRGSARLSRLAALAFAVVVAGLSLETTGRSGTDSWASAS